MHHTKINQRQRKQRIKIMPYTYEEMQEVVELQAQANKNLTNEQFKNLARNDDGDIIELSSVFFLINEKQKEKISGDDWSRMDMLEEDMRCMMAEF